MPRYIIACSYGAGERGSYRLSVLSGSGLEEDLDLSLAQLASIGDEIRGQLSDRDALWDDGTLYDLVAFDGDAGDEVEILLQSAVFDAYLRLYGPDGEILAYDDDSGGGSDALLLVLLPEDGRYTVFVNSYFGGEQGPYVLRIARPDAPG
jgi:serine protease Do